MKVRATTKILFGFVGLIGLAYVGRFGYTKWQLVGVDLKPIPSSDFCLLAIGPKANVKTIIANRMVQIVESSDKFGGEAGIGGGVESGAVKKRIPVKELVGVLGGDADSAQSFVKKMREFNEDSEAVDETPMWTKEDLEKAIASPGALRTKLEFDIGTSIDGKPKPILNRLSFFYGIRIKVPITFTAPNAKGETIQTVDIVTFKPKILNRFYKQMQTKFYDKSQLQNFYASYLKEETPELQDIGATLKAIFAGTEASSELRKAEQIAKYSTILVNQPMIESVSMETQSEGKAITYDLKIRLNSEGKNRLLKFSSEGGTQILVISKGVAIAAATIGTQLSSQELVIKQIADRQLLEDAVSLIHSKT